MIFFANSAKLPTFVLPFTNPVRWVSGLNRRPPSDNRKGAFCGEGGMLAEASSCLLLQTSPWGRLSRFAPKPAARRAGMCDRREQIPQVRGYHSRFAPKPAAHFTVHNGSKSRDSVPLRNPPAECAASTDLLKQDGLSGPCHNGSKSRDSVPLRNPPTECAVSTGLLKRGDLSDPSHNGSKPRDSVPLRNPPTECAVSTGLLKRGGLSDPSHNGSKSRDSVPLRNPRPAASFFAALQET